eukprot:3173206-Pleurochrysis_carterae.AAC.4
MHACPCTRASVREWAIMHGAVVTHDATSSSSLSLSSLDQNESARQSALPPAKTNTLACGGMCSTM